MCNQGVFLVTSDLNKGVAGAVGDGVAINGDIDPWLAGVECSCEVGAEGAFGHTAQPITRTTVMNGASAIQRNLR